MVVQLATSPRVGEVLPGSETGEIVYSETQEEIQRLREGDVSIFEQAGVGKGVLSGEEYRQELRKALQDPALERDLIDLPWGSGSGMARVGAQPGYVFCARVGDHPTPIFRHIATAGVAEPSIVGDTLSCLAEAKPDAGPETDRVLDEDTYRRAFEAWKHAKDDIVTAWNLASDPANLQPKIPKAMHDAAELIRSNPPPGMTVEETDELIGALQAPYPERIVRAIRNAMAVSDDPAAQAAEVAVVARDLGLEPSPPPEPLPEIEDDDVHLVCWLAVVSGVSG